MKQLDKYNEAVEEINQYFNYQPGWALYPIDDCRDMFWRVVEGGCSVEFADSIEELRTETGNFYSNELINNKVYRGAEFTAMEVDTHCDGNKFFQIFDNSKEVTDESDSPSSAGEN